MKATKLSPQLLLVAVTVAGVAACTNHPTTGPDGNEEALSRSSLPVIVPARSQNAGIHRFEDFSEVPGARASLLRQDVGLRFTIQTTDLPRGDALTIWWVIFNYPEHCQHPVEHLMQCGEPDLFDEDVSATVLLAAGHVIGGSGIGNFAGSLRVGETSGCQPPLGDFGLCRQGLLNPQGAEVHFVLRGHGGLLPGSVDDQIRTFAGGCTPESSFGAGTGTNPCEDLQFAILTAP